MTAPAPLVSVVLPCLNEAEALEACLTRLQRTIDEHAIDAEIVVCDNGSTDGSAAIAERLGARVVHEPVRGYGRAYLTGFAHARGRVLVMGDADDTYDFSLLPAFLEKMRAERLDFVTGSRYLGDGGERIPFLHRYVGNPFLTRLLNGLFRTSYSDVYCGFRVFTREAYERIRPVSGGMEFNLELAINAGLAGLRVAEVPIRLRPRKGRSKLRTVRDGMRSLRLMLLYSPNTLFVVPGAALLGLGLGLHLALLAGLGGILGAALGAAGAMLALMLSVLGFEILSLGLHAKTYAWTRRFQPDNAGLRRFYDRFTLRTGLAAGAALFAGGLGVLGALAASWLGRGGTGAPAAEWVAFGATLVILGVSVVFSSLFISTMSLHRRADAHADGGGGARLAVEPACGS